MPRGKHAKRAALRRRAAMEAAVETAQSLTLREERARGEAEKHRAQAATLIREVMALERELERVTADEVARLVADNAGLREEIQSFEQSNSERRARNKQFETRYQGGTHFPEEVERTAREAGEEVVYVGDLPKPALDKLPLDVVKQIQRARGQRRRSAA